jgi:hypothetical protein
MAGLNCKSNSACITAVTAQGAPGKIICTATGMPLQIDTLSVKPINALVFLDIQVGHSTVKAEVAELGKISSMPNVHLELTLNFR